MLQSSEEVSVMHNGYVFALIIAAGIVSVIPSIGPAINPTSYQKVRVSNSTVMPTVSTGGMMFTWFSAVSCGHSGCKVR